jgi:serine phosphatase RsbU (regulator of sigma subunit)
MTRPSRAHPLELAGLAALALHEPHLSAPDVIEALTDQIRAAGLAEDVHYVPAGQHPPPLPRDPELTALPVRRPLTSGGSLVGTLWVRVDDPEAKRALETLAEHAGLALDAVERRDEIADREERMRRVAEKLQDALLPTLPDLPQTSLAVRYRAAAREARVGGDFYDVFPMPTGHVLIVVGDVMGKGVEAASRTSRITQTLRALALQGLRLDALLERVDEQVSFQDPHVMATLWCGLYDPAAAEIEFASLGHPPALLLRSEGEPISLQLEGLPLGLRDLAEDPPEVRRRKLAPRDLLVLYTDGVVEVSGDVLEGIDALLATIRGRRDQPLQAAVDEALAELLAGGGHTDDAVMLLLRRR